MKILAVDPGLHCAGWSLFVDGRLHGAGFVKGPFDEKDPLYARVNSIADVLAETCTPDDLDLFVIEVPQVYERKRSKQADPNDLIKLAVLVGAVLRNVTCKTLTPLPREWKGQVKKEVTENRMKRKLSPMELQTIELPSAPSEHNNVWDAVGLGHWASRRSRGR
jgi:hypothetical protein